MPIPLFLFVVIFTSQPNPSLSSSSSLPHCGSSQAKVYQKCTSLPTQSASVAWTFHRENATLDATFFGSFISPSGWVGWGLNPSGPTMIGARVLLAFPDPITARLVLLPFVLSSTVKFQRSPLFSRPLDQVSLFSSSASLHHSAASGVRFGAGVQIRATIVLPSNSTTHLHMVWNRGLYVQGYSPAIHPTSPSDLSSTITLDLISATTAATSHSTSSLKVIHATINAAAWGLLLPGGALAARYLRHAEPTLGPTWFYAHVAIQLTGFSLGLVGFGLGLKIGSGSSHPYSLHRKLGFAAVGLGSIQTLAVLFRPKTTNRFRRYWKSYHHMVGYSCVVVGIVNVFQGFEAMGQVRSYGKLAYCMVLAALVGVCLSLEVNSWVIFCRDAKEEMMRRDGLVNDVGTSDKGSGMIMLHSHNNRSA